MLEILVETLLPVVDEILVTAPEGYEQRMQAILSHRAKVITGGSTRQDSISCLIGATQADTVLIQDAARPFPSRSLCRQVLSKAQEHGAAGAFLNPAVPIGLLRDDKVSCFFHKEEVGIFQAPQAFSKALLKQAYRDTDEQHFQSTAQMLMEAGHTLVAVPGEASNIKITTALDWHVAQQAIAPFLGIT